MQASKAGQPGEELLILPSRDDIHAAAGRLQGLVRRTPVMSVVAGDLCDHSAVLKLEHCQHSGSFKARGAFNSILTAEVTGAGVCAASGGNHGAAVAYAAARLGHTATVFVPSSTPEVKAARIAAYGATVVRRGDHFRDADAACADFAAERGALRVHAYDDAQVMAGQGTVAREWQEQTPGLDTVLVAVGGGGLISGVATWFKGSGTRVVGVEPEHCCALYEALANDGPIDVPIDSLAADALGATNVGPRVHAVCAEGVDEVIRVDDQAILEAQRRLWHLGRQAVELAGAAALAALISGAYQSGGGEKIGVLLCGANFDPSAVG